MSELYTKILLVQAPKIFYKMNKNYDGHLHQLNIGFADEYYLKSIL